MKLYNTLSRQIEDFEPINPPHVNLYACGPTVYDYQHIGNLRTATLMDVVQRTLRYIGFNVTTVMNITDVDDKIEKRARETKSQIKDITEKFENIYKKHLSLLNIAADEYPHATDNISEMIEIIKVLLEKDIAYQNSFGIYFDISKDKDYGKLGDTFKSSKERPRIEVNEDKRNAEDFALWKFPTEGEERQLLWESPWGKGFPGWHIECSAMSMKFMSKAFTQKEFHPEDFETIDLHIGGEDLKEIHHENEIAQSESATGKQFVKYWMHGAMLNIKDDKMSKSLNNFITLQELIEKGVNPIILRFFYFSTHYRKLQNFTWEALDNAQNGYYNLLDELKKIYVKNHSEIKPDENYKKKFIEIISDDFNMPQAVALIWETLKTDLDSNVKIATILDFDKVLGLKLEENIKGLLDNKPHFTEEELKYLQDLISQRNAARTEKDFTRADIIKKQILEMGVEITDTGTSTEWRLK